jgi:hypothetical protein
MNRYSTWTRKTMVIVGTYAEAVAAFESIESTSTREMVEHFWGRHTLIRRCGYTINYGNGNRWKRRFLAREFAEVERSENLFNGLGYYPGQTFMRTTGDREKFYEDLLKQAGRKNHRKHINHERKIKDSRGCVD